MGIKKNAGKIQQPKKQVKATFAECKAENPLECKYHGLVYLDKQILPNAMKDSNGNPIPYVCDKDGNKYEIRIGFEHDWHQPVDNLNGMLKKQGWNVLVNHDKMDGKNCYKLTLTKGDDFQFLTPSDEADLSYESEEAPVDGDDLVGSPDEAPVKETYNSGVTDEDIKDFLVKYGYSKAEVKNYPEKYLAQWHNMIGNGIGRSGSKLGEYAIDSLKEMMSVAGKDHPVSKVLAKTIAKLEGNPIPEDQPKKVDKPKVETEKKEENVEPKEEPKQVQIDLNNITDKDLSEWIAPSGKKISDFFYDHYKEAILHGTYTAYGISGPEPLSIEAQKDIKEIADAAGKDHPLSKLAYSTLEKLKNGEIKVGGEETEEDDGEVTKEDIVDLFGKDADITEKETEIYAKEVNTGKKENGDALSKFSINYWNEVAKMHPDHKVSKVWTKTLEKLKGEGRVSNGGESGDITAEDLINTYSDVFSSENMQSAKDIANEINNGTDYSGNQIDAEEQEYVSGIVESKPDSKVAKVWEKTLAKLKGDTDQKKSGTGHGVEYIDQNSVDLNSLMDDGFKDYIAGGEQIDTEFGADIDDMKKMLVEEVEEEGGEDEITADDIKDLFNKCGIKKDKLLSDENLEATKEALKTGKWNGKPLTKGNKNWYQMLAKKVPNHKVAKAITEMLSSENEKFKPKKNKLSQAMIDALSGNNDSEDKDKSESGKKTGKSIVQTGPINAEVSKDLLKPLEHDELKFPPNLTKAEIDKAIQNGKKAGGHGGLNTTIVEIGGKKYICKNGSGHNAKVVKNGYAADMGYRAGGIYAPDAKLYEFGDGKVYKLSEFIEGKRLIDVWKNASTAEREGISKELLKGYPLDVLFSNYDVLGTSPEDSQKVTIIGEDGNAKDTYVAFNNIILGDDGHAYRIDNDGAFALSGTGGQKSSSGGSYSSPVQAETWDSWGDRQWIDDFRTMRRNEKNAGIFDRYSTADIFLSAGNINLDSVVNALPEQTQNALAKPLFEMKQMTFRAVSADLSGIKNNDMLSSALDATYEASKKKFRELCTGEISFSSGGIGAKKSDKGSIPPYPVPKPEPPEDPSKKFSAGAMLSNSEYTGTKVSDIILAAAKTINYHAGFVMTDKDGKKLGGGNALPTPDYNPNSSKIAEFKRIDREKLVELAKTSQEAKLVLDNYDSVATSVGNGYKLPVQEVVQTSIKEQLPVGFKTKQEEEFLTHKAEVMEKFNAEMKVYQHETLPKYNQDKKDWEEKEKAKLNSGANGLEGNFYDIANEFMEANYDTDGNAQHNGESIDFIELGKYQNKYGGGVSGSTTHNDSWTPASSHLKVLDLLMTGMSIDEIIDIKDNDPLINNGHHSGKKAKDWFIGEAKSMKANQTQTKREMIAYAVFKGLQVLKLENESAGVKVSTGGTVDWIDHSCHTVGLIRKESFSNASYNSIAPMFQKGGNASCGFQSNGCINYYPYAYDVPLWNVSYTYSDENHKGSKVDSYKGSEHEWVASLVGLTPFRVNESTNASQNIQLFRSNAELKKNRDARIIRLAPFFTTMEGIKKIA